MKILITADLHYDITRSRRPARRLARRICAEGGDALVLVGDTAGSELAPMEEALDLFGRFAGRKLMVPGNHCLWCRPGESSVDRYERILPDLVAAHGFSVLDHSPVILGRVGLVGSIGWYDYSFADESLKIPEAFYRAKVAPGAAMQLGGYDELLEEHRGRLADRARLVYSRWMDGMRVRLGMSDEAFCDLLAERLGEQLRQLSEQVDRIIVFLHHLPFVQLVPRNRPDRFAFAAAFLGSGRFGEVLLEFPKVTHVFCGHSHWPLVHVEQQVTAINIGSTYVDKRLEILEL